MLLNWHASLGVGEKATDSVDLVYEWHPVQVYQVPSIPRRIVVESIPSTPCRIVKVYEWSRFGGIHLMSGL